MKRKSILLIALSALATQVNISAEQPDQNIIETLSKVTYQEKIALDKANKEYDLTSAIYNEKFSNFEKTLKKLHETLKDEDLTNFTNLEDIVKSCNTQKDEIDKQKKTKEKMLDYLKTKSNSFSEKDINNFLNKYEEIEKSLKAKNKTYRSYLIQLYTNAQNEPLSQKIDEALQNCKSAEQDLKKTEEIFKESINKLKLAQKDLFTNLASE